MAHARGAGTDRKVPRVIGIGNELRRDDGCGVAAARSLRPLLAGRAAVHELTGDATNLLDLWEGADLAVVIDGVRSGSDAGTIRRIEVGPEELGPAFSPSSTHGLSLAEGVALGRSLGRFPVRLIVYGIEVRDVAMGTGLTAPVARAVREVVARVEREIPGPHVDP